MSNNLRHNIFLPYATSVCYNASWNMSKIHTTAWMSKELLTKLKRKEEKHTRSEEMTYRGMASATLVEEDQVREHLNKLDVYRTS